MGDTKWKREGNERRIEEGQWRPVLEGGREGKREGVRFHTAVNPFITPVKYPVKYLY